MAESQAGGGQERSLLKPVACHARMTPLAARPVGSKARPPAGEPPQRRCARTGGPVTGDEPVQSKIHDTKSALAA